MAWFVRSKKNIEEETIQRDMPDGLWTKCPDCNEIIYKRQLEENLFTCEKCNHHFRVGTKEYIDIIFDNGTFEELFTNVKSADPLGFYDSKPYSKRLDAAYASTGLADALSVGIAKLDGKEVVFSSMNFSFIGGSMGAVVGEKFYKAARIAIEKKIPFIQLCASGGARMQEAAYSLMQMAKTSAAIAELAENDIPYLVILTDPTTGGVSASFGMLGDIHIAEPGALIGFAGPRVIEQTIKKKLPPGFQRAEFVRDHGFLDKIVHRKNMREFLIQVLSWFRN
jgi:acetyl-CoA carboxylase carboxyl transferase subunit beta